MAVADRIRTKLEAAFAPLRLVVQDARARRAGHAGSRPGGETLFWGEIPPGEFSGWSRMERRRRVHAVLADEWAGPVHPLWVRALAPEDTAAPASSATPRRG